LRQSKGKSLEDKTRTKQRRALEKIPVAAATACASVLPSVRPPSDYYLLCCRQSNQINYKADRNHRPLRQQAIDEKRQNRERREEAEPKKNKREEANKQTKAPLEKGNG
jgi:hypothetical protein